ncbi:MAG: SagB/ThcOx family dehydrogenase [Thermodesulfobacteriota bacterium]
MPKELDQLLAYHQATKHSFTAYAHGPAYLDQATQPNPFRRYIGTQLIKLEQVQCGEEPSYESAFLRGQISPAPLNLQSISQLFYDSLALSAWKRAGNATWPLRINPSSGNLHPTEGYIICGPVSGLCKTPMVCHYAVMEHGMEVRAEFPLSTWNEMTVQLPKDVVLVGFTSIHWREAWKYGERAYRYCQLDIGHAVAAVSIAASGLGWQATLLDDIGTEELSNLLGTFEPHDAETEHPDCILAVYPQGKEYRGFKLPGEFFETFKTISWQGKPNQLSPDHIEWPIIGTVEEATKKPQSNEIGGSIPSKLKPLSTDTKTFALRSIIHQRRSAVAMDGLTAIPRNIFYKILEKTLAGPERIPFNGLPWSPFIHLLLFVHRVKDLEAGLYILMRNSEKSEPLKSAMSGRFLWERPEGLPVGLDLYRLARGDVRTLSRELSCHQEIASDGCFSLGMIADFNGPLKQLGPWSYPRLFWECGMIGQILYLEAEAAGIRGTGIGCFFDDPVHELLGLDTKKNQYQDLYHFTLGKPVEDTRITTLPAYPKK